MPYFSPARKFKIGKISAVFPGANPVPNRIGVVLFLERGFSHPLHAFSPNRVLMHFLFGYSSDNFQPPMKVGFRSGDHQMSQPSYLDQMANVM
jgi:hypothetical protein